MTALNYRDRLIMHASVYEFDHGSKHAAPTSTRIFLEIRTPSCAPGRANIKTHTMKKSLRNDFCMSAAVQILGWERYKRSAETVHCLRAIHGGINET